MRLIMYFVLKWFLLVVFHSTLGDVYKPHCNITHPTCSKQLPFDTRNEGNCKIKRIARDSAECRDVSLILHANTDLGKVRLHDFLYPKPPVPNNSYFTTGLNATFSDIHWTRLFIQYKDRFNESHNFCRQFSLDSSLQLPPSTSLFYDCLWSLTYEDREFDFRYEANDNKTGKAAGRHYIFRVPRFYNMFPDKPLKTWPVFMYIDITELPLLTLHWQAVPYTNVTNYQVTVYHESTAVHTVQITDPPDDEGQYSFSYSMGFTSGNFYFTVQVVHAECDNECEVFRSPLISIAETETRTPLLIGIVGSVVLLPAFLYSLYIWKRYSLTALVRNPVVVLVYRRSLASHIRAVVALAKYMRTVCHLETLIDELDIPLTKTKDPFLWYQEAFIRADVVLVVSSPAARNDVAEEGIYHKLDVVALRILADKYSDPLTQLKFMSLVLPYCAREDVPLEARNLKCFCFRKDLNELLWHIRYGVRSFWLSKIDYLCYRSQIPGGESDLARHGKSLLDAFQAAEEDAKKQTVSSSGKANDEDMDSENIPLQDADSLTSEISFTFPLPDSKPDNCDLEGAYSQYPGNIQDMNLLGGEDSTEQTPHNNRSSTGGKMNIDSLIL